MAWNDTLQQCTFRGVPIIVETDSLKVGRRTVRHEYPLRDKPYSEDMGRAVREITVAGKLLGDDVYAQRDRLVNATETPGPATFVHPSIGKMTVVCESCEITESTSDGRTVAVQLTLVESGDLEFPREAVSPVGAVAQASADLDIENGTWLDEALQIRDQVGAVVDRAVDTVADRIDAARAIMRTLGDVATVGAVIGDLDRMAASLSDKILEPATLVAEWCGIMQAVGGSAASVIAETHLSDLADSETAADETGLSETEQIARENTRALDTMFATAALSAACVSASDTDWVVRDDAEDAVEALDDLISTLEGFLRDRALADALAELRRMLAERILSEAIDLPSLVPYWPRGLESVFEIAQRCYGDYERAEEIVARLGDGIPHPGFVGFQIEVAER